jgi:hypothetical protein
MIETQEDANKKAQIHAKVDPKVKTDAQVKALRVGITLSDAIEQFLQAWASDDLELPRGAPKGGPRGEIKPAEHQAA